MGLQECDFDHQPTGKGGTRSPPANPKWPPGGPKMADGVWKGVYSQVFEHSKQLSLNKFFDPEKKRKKKKDNNDVYSGH